MLHDFYIFFYSKKKLSSHDALTTTHHDLSLYDIQLEKIILVLRIINIVYDDGKIRGFKFQPCFQKFLRKYLLDKTIHDKAWHGWQWSDEWNLEIDI